MPLARRAGDGGRRQPLLNGGVSALAGRAAWSLAGVRLGLARLQRRRARPARRSSPSSPLLASPGVGAGRARRWPCGAIAVTSLGLTVDDTRPPARRRPAAARSPPRSASIVADPPLRAVTVSTTSPSPPSAGCRSRSSRRPRRSAGRPADAGIALTVSAVGGLGGSLAMTRRPAPRRPAATVLASLAAIGVVLVAMAAGSWPLLLVGAFVAGRHRRPAAGRAVRDPQRASPPHLRATVFTIGASAKLGAASIGALAAGLLLDGRAHRRPGSSAIGAVHLVAVGVGWLSLRRSAPAPAPGTSPSRPPPAARR